MASISRRKYITFSSDTASHEPTTTLVLTSPQGRIIDIRIFKTVYDFAYGDTTVDVPHWREPGHPQVLGEINFLDWAFWGWARSTEVEWSDVEGAMMSMGLGPERLSDVREGGKVRKCVWEHVLDSKVHAGRVKEIDDQGLMFGTGVEGEELEIGRMENPGTGVVEDYEELWEDVKVENPPWMNRKCAVWHCSAPNSDEGAIEGVFVRVGQFAQGMWTRIDDMIVERWEADLQARRWNWMMRIGVQHLTIYPPFLALLGGENGAERGRMVIDGLEWRLIEEHG